MKEQKQMYIVINENYIVTGIFYQEIKFEKGKSIWNTQKQNFDEETDFQKAILINPDNYGKLQIGSLYVPETSQEENSENI